MCVRMCICSVVCVNTSDALNKRGSLAALLQCSICPDASCGNECVSQLFRGSAELQGRDGTI